MPTRNVVLTDHQAGLVEQLVASGRYQNASEVLREGLRLVEQRDAEQAARVEAFRNAVQRGEEDLAAGHIFTYDQAFIDAVTLEARESAKSGSSSPVNGQA
jgi:antitoxin ParD1/3/4